MQESPSLHAIGFGSLNLDEFWEVDADFLLREGLKVGEEYVRDVEWFERVYPLLKEQGTPRGIDPGGSAANMIAALRRMGFDTGFFGAAGRSDAEGLRLDELGSRDNLRILASQIPSGRCLALIDRDDPGKDRALVILPNANDMAGCEGLDLAFFGQASWVHFTSFVSLEPLLVQARLAQDLPTNTRISFDPGAVYCALGVKVLEQILRRVDVLFATPEELADLSGREEELVALEELFALGVGTVVVKRGANGISAFRPDAAYYSPAVQPAAITDRTGAGDVAAAGFIAGMILSLSIGGSLELAATAASKSIEGYGRSTYPDRALLEAFLARRRDS